MLPRVLEPELMDSDQEALDYDTMDHSTVNRTFVDDLLAACAADSPIPLGDVLDLGTGTAQIPIELAEREPHCRIMAADAAVSMFELARYNVEAAGLLERIQLVRVDAKQLGFADGLFDTVISNSIVHHIPQPRVVLAEALRVTKPGGLLFFRDLLRPRDEATLTRQVETHAGSANDHQRQMFADSLHAALTLAEMQEFVASLGFAPHTVSATSDRHWTWCVRK